MKNERPNFPAAAWYLSAALFVLLVPASSFSQSRRTLIAVLDFGSSGMGLIAPNPIREMFSLDDAGVASHEFEVADRDLTRSAARGAGYAGSLNMSLREARDLGAAIGCDFYFIGDAQTLRRSSSTKPIFYETYAAIFLVSARTGKLILWERPSVEGDSVGKSLKQFMTILSSEKTAGRYIAAVRRALQDERTERAAAIENRAPIIEALSDEEGDENKDVRAPRPYRRLKPQYPETAAQAEVEATVDALVDIDSQGEISRVEIGRWAGYGLDQAVVDTVRQLHFFPAMRDGVAIPMRVLLRYNFRKPAQNHLQ